MTGNWVHAAISPGSLSREIYGWNESKTCGNYGINGIVILDGERGGSALHVINGNTVTVDLCIIRV